MVVEFGILGLIGVGGMQILVSVVSLFLASFTFWKMFLTPQIDRINDKHKTFEKQLENTDKRFEKLETKVDSIISTLHEINNSFLKDKIQELEKKSA